MSFLTRRNAEELLAQLLQTSHVDEMHAVLRSADGTAYRIADNIPDAPHRSAEASLRITVRVGKRYASAGSNDLSSAGMHELVDRAVRLATVMPEVAQVLPFPGPPSRTSTDSPSSSQEQLQLPGADTIRLLMDLAGSADLQMSGSLAVTRSTLSVANSQGLFLHYPSDLLHAQFRVYTRDGSSTGFGEHFSPVFEEGSLLRTLQTAVEKCRAWKDPVSMEPSRITTVFEPRALADMLVPLLQQFSSRAIQDDQSFLRKLDGSTFVGTRMFLENVTFRSDPFMPRLRVAPFTLDGLAVKPETWVRNGVIAQIATDRFLAAEQGIEALPPPANLIMEGGTKDLETLISETSRGLLLSGFADLRIVDPKNCLLTGSTRDGLFLIEEGKITQAVRNLLIRETPVYLLKELEEIGQTETTSATGSYFPMHLPPLRVKDVLYGASSGLI
ncbi:MAG: hypothetical protein JXA28_15050 [Bacteroidetes bacterium]|nr:hypothetical protein [Bacteroidota bacterium]